MQRHSLSAAGITRTGRGFVFAVALTVVLVLVSVPPAAADARDESFSARTGYGEAFREVLTPMDPVSVTCRIQYQDTGAIKEERMTVSVREIAGACESGGIAFIVPFMPVMHEPGPAPEPAWPEENKED